MNIQISYYLNKLTGEVLGSREKRKLDKELLMDKSLFQVLKGVHPVIFVRMDENDDYEGLAVEKNSLTVEKLENLGKQGYSLSENYQPNADVPRQFGICANCLKKVDEILSYSQINLDEIENYFELRRKEVRYFEVVTCSCGNDTKYTKLHRNFKSIDDIEGLDELIVNQVIEVEEKDPLLLEQKITEVLVEKIYDLEKVKATFDLNNHEDFDVLKKLLKHHDYLRLGNIKFKRINNYFQSKEIEKKYKVKQRLL